MACTDLGSGLVKRFAIKTPKSVKVQVQHKWTQVCTRVLQAWFLVYPSVQMK